MAGHRTRLDHAMCSPVAPACNFVCLQTFASQACTIAMTRTSAPRLDSAVIHAAGTRDMWRMGALGARMPFVRTVFVIGALSLAGLPILNGFWSKELVLEAGLTGGPSWALWGMLLGAGLTACYTFRMVWLVFYGEARSKLDAHDATTAMRISLSLLALGTLTSWLLAGSFGHLLESTLPFHKMHAISTSGMLLEVLEAPLTSGALIVIAAGLLAWSARARLQGVTGAFSWFTAAARQSFGFEGLNWLVVSATRAVATGFRITQPGHLSWNVVGIVGGLLAVLILLTWGI